MREQHAGGVPAGLSPAQCLALLGSVGVGRLGFTQAALPVIWPVDFLLHGEQVVIGTGSGGEWAAAIAGGTSVVAFEADRLDGRGRALWSVLVIGRGRCVLIDIDQICGRRFPPRP